LLLHDDRGRKQQISYIQYHQFATCYKHLMTSSWI